MKYIHTWMKTRGNTETPHHTTLCSKHSIKHASMCTADACDWTKLYNANTTLAVICLYTYTYTHVQMCPHTRPHTQTRTASYTLHYIALHLRLHTKANFTFVAPMRRRSSGQTCMCRFVQIRVWKGSIIARYTPLRRGVETREAWWITIYIHRKHRQDKQRDTSTRNKRSRDDGSKHNEPAPVPHIPKQKLLVLHQTETGSFIKHSCVLS